LTDFVDIAFVHFLVEDFGDFCSNLFNLGSLSIGGQFYLFGVSFSDSNGEESQNISVIGSQIVETFD